MNDVSVSQDDRTVAMIGHLSGIVAGFIGPLIIWLINKDKADKGGLNGQAKEALNFQITMCIGWLAASVLSVVLIGLILVPILLIANIILCIMAGLKANEGVDYYFGAPPLFVRLLNREYVEKAIAALLTENNGRWLEVYGTLQETETP